jgi:hypothetical protein
MRSRKGKTGGARRRDEDGDDDNDDDNDDDDDDDEAPIPGTDLEIIEASAGPLVDLSLRRRAVGGLIIEA